MIKRFVKFRPPVKQFGIGDLELWRIARDVDPYDVHPDVALYFDQTQQGSVNAIGGILTRPTHMWRGDKASVSRVTPAVIGAANGTFDIAGCID